MGVSKKASARKTSSAREAAGQQAAARKAQRQKAESAAATRTKNRQQLGKTGAKAIRGHIAARTQRQQARRDSR